MPTAPEQQQFINRTRRNIGSDKFRQKSPDEKLEYFQEAGRELFFMMKETGVQNVCPLLLDLARDIERLKDEGWRSRARLGNAFRRALAKPPRKKTPGGPKP